MVTWRFEKSAFFNLDLRFEVHLSGLLRIVGLVLSRSKTECTETDNAVLVLLGDLNCF